MGPAILDNGENIGIEKTETRWELCYQQGWKETPPTLGGQPVPNFPFDWVPTQKEGGTSEGFSEKNPYNRPNFTRRGEAHKKIIKSLEKWRDRLEKAGDPKTEKIKRLAWRVSDCAHLSVGLDGGKLAKSQTGAAFFRSVGRCNSRFCPRCARKVGRRGLERIFKRCGINPDQAPENMRFLTLTLPGEKGEPLPHRFGRLKKALKKLYKTGLWRDRVEGAIGKIEVTKNGDNWHPHAHFLIVGRFLPAAALRVVWAECIGEDFEKILIPWIEPTRKGKGAFFEIAKYIAKPVAFLGQAKTSKKNDKQGISERSKEWTDSEMIEFFEVFQSARIYTTTGIFKAKKGADDFELPKRKEEQEEEATLKDILSECPVVFDLAKTGEGEALSELISKAGAQGFTKTQVLTELAFMVFYSQLEDRPPPTITRWSDSPKRLEEARVACALAWERRQVFQEAITQAREELRQACERNAASW